MDLGKLDAELNVKIIESIKEILKNKDTKISFENPHDEILEGSTINSNDSNFILVKRLIITEIDDVNPKYRRFLGKKIVKQTVDRNQPQAIKYVKNNTKYLLFLRQICGKKIVKKEIRKILF